VQAKANHGLKRIAAGSFGPLQAVWFFEMFVYVLSGLVPRPAATA
jgi:hypothetical protein